jgi:hypothetical protein
MEGVIDSVSVNDLLRRPKGGNTRNAPLATSLDEHIKGGGFRVAMDRRHQIIDEWCQTCGQEQVRALVTKWVDLAAFRSVDQPGVLSPAAIKRLKQFGFKDRPVDKLLLRTAMGCTGRLLVSRDTDFWDPQRQNVHPVGDRSGSIVTFCREELNVIVRTLADVLVELRQAANGTNRSKKTTRITKATAKKR